MRIGPFLALFVLPACAGEARLDGTDAGPPDPGVEAGVGRDGSAAVDSGAPLAGEDFASDGCFNGIDDNADAIIDCDDQPACGGSAYCCVGAPSASCCVLPGASLTANFQTCGGGDPRACAAGPSFDWFGTPQPTLEGNAFVPNGDQLDDSGLILSDPIDPTDQRITLQASIAAPIDGCSDCIDVIALGLADPMVPGMEVRIVPDVAVMVRASRRDVALFIAGAVVGDVPLVDEEAHDYELIISPDGSVSLEIDDVLALDARMNLRPGRVPVLYGRTHNRTGGSEPARAFDVNVRTTGCDIPSALERDGSTVIPFGGVDFGTRIASNPSAIQEADDMLVAFSLGRDVHLAREDSADAWRLAGSSRIEAPVITAGLNEVLLDPELLREGDHYVIYVTRSPFEGPTTIARAEGAAGFGESFGPLVDVTLPPDASPVSNPTVVNDGELRMAIRTELAGNPVIALLQASDLTGTEFVWASASIEASVVVETHEDFARFDHDDVSDPELVVDGAGLLRLYYAGRRGTRWGIGARVSGDRFTWREPENEALLAGTGVGHDSLWTRHPSVTITEGAVDLFYTASDGITLDIGRARGSAR